MKKAILIIFFSFLFFMNSTSAEAECLDDWVGRTSCAPPGGGIKMSYGKAYCGIGQCVRDRLSGRVVCSDIWMGWATIDKLHNIASCSGTCVEGKESLCEIP